MFDEVPALRLEGDFLGLFVAVHGLEGDYILLIKPKPYALRDVRSEVLLSDISNYVAELVRSASEWHVEVPKA